MAKEAGAAKPEAHKPEAAAPSVGGSKKGPAQMPGGCLSWGCKVEANRFNFCSQHYEHFKFGLIKKTGEPVPDFEKKWEHFQAHLAKSSGKKVA